METIIVRIDPNMLEVNPQTNELKVRRIANKCHTSPVVVLPDYDATLWVADGNNRVKAACLKGEPVEALLVDDDYPIGKQSAIDRVLGIFFRKRE